MHTMDYIVILSDNVTLSKKRDKFTINMSEHVYYFSVFPLKSPPQIKTYNINRNQSTVAERRADSQILPMETACSSASAM